MATGQLVEAYRTLDPLARGVAPPGSLRWSAQLARARLLAQLGGTAAAAAELPARPRFGNRATWAEIAWLLAHGELEQSAMHADVALGDARRADHLLAQLTPPGHHLRADAWLGIAAAHKATLQFDSAIQYAERARALLATRTIGHGPTGLRARLMFPVLTPLPVLVLLAAALHDRAETSTAAVRVGRLRFASDNAAAAAFLDSASRYLHYPHVDAAQQMTFWWTQGLHWADQALDDDDERIARRADADFANAADLARTPAQHTTIACLRGELAGGIYGSAAALPIYEQAVARLKAAAGESASPADSVTRVTSFNSMGPDVCYLLEQQAAAYRDRYAQTHAPHDLNQFFVHATQLADVLALRREQARRGYATESRGDAFTPATIADNYALGVEAAEARYHNGGGRPADLALAFRITQTAKAWRLLTRVGGERATAGLRTNERLLKRYQRATAELLRWEDLRMLVGAYPALLTARGFVGAADSARAARTRLAAITSALQRKHPTLYARAFNGSYALPLAAAQAALPANGQTAAVEFLRRSSYEEGSSDGLYRETLYAFVVQRHGTQLLRLPLPAGFGGLIDSLVTALAHPSSPAYAPLAARAYALVLAPVAQVLAPGVRQLVVAPDGELWRLPFEALLTRPPSAAEARKPDYRRLPYALRRWNFTYAHSLTLRARAQAGTGSRSANRAAPPARILALAPFSDDAQTHGLPFSGRLLTWLAGTTDGDFYTGAAASRTALRHGAATADVLHLATHASADLADPAASSLALADGPLPLADLFSLSLHPRLVVLSACQTGVGRVDGPSESATSLSWGFTYIGAGSTIATLWRVDDAATATELERFYRLLGTHNAKNIALHRAKLAAIDSARTAAAADPFYWAGLVLTGDERPLDLAPPPPWWASSPGALVATVALALVGAGSWWWWRRRRTIPHGTT